MKAASSSLAALLVVAAGIAIGAGSRVSWSYEEDDRAVLRLSWRAPGGRVESCRPLTPEEEEQTPVHMRRSQVCETTGLPYLLRLTVDGAEALADSVRPAGARADRPVVVFREFELEAGVHDIAVEFLPLVPPDSRAAGLETEEEEESDDELGEESEDEEEEERHEDERKGRSLEALRLTRSLRLDPGDVALVTYDPRRRTLVLRQPSARADR